MLDEQSLSFTLSTEFTQSGKDQKPPPTDLLQIERHYRQSGHKMIAGVDEAGRGPLAGPVVAACVALPDNFDISGIDDSKKLSRQGRETAYRRIVDRAVFVTTGTVGPEDIDRLNVLRATHLAMLLAVQQIPLTPDLILVDGLPVPTMSGCPQYSIVDGDAKSASIAAASIVAKVTRDRMMMEYSLLYPNYGFERHKGYGTSLHLEALRKFGPCPIHRKSFSPIAAWVEETLFE